MAVDSRLGKFMMEQRLATDIKKRLEFCRGDFFLSHLLPCYGMGGFHLEACMKNDAMERDEWQKHSPGADD